MIKINIHKWLLIPLLVVIALSTIAATWVGVISFDGQRSGDLIFVNSSNQTDTLHVGSIGQVLTVNGNNLPSWQTSSSDGSGGGPSIAGRAATLVIASSDASPNEKAQADIVCNGVNDQNTINNAINTVSSYGAGSIKCLGKTFYISGSVNYSAVSSMSAFSFDSKGTVFKAAANMTNMVNLCAGNSAQIDGTAHIELGMLDGNVGSGYTVSHLIYIRNFADNYLSLQGLIHSSGDGVYIDESGTPYTGTFDNIFDISSFAILGGTAIKIDDNNNGSGHNTQGNIFRVGDIIACANGILVGQTVDYSACHNTFICGSISANGYGIYDNCGWNNYSVGFCSGGTYGAEVPSGLGRLSIFTGFFNGLGLNMGTQLVNNNQNGIGGYGTSTNYGYDVLVSNATKAITPGAGTFFGVDNYGGASTGDITTINGAFKGRVIALRLANFTHQVTLKNAGGSGNLALGADFTLSDYTKSIVLICYDGTNWAILSKN